MEPYRKSLRDVGRALHHLAVLRGLVPGTAAVPFVVFGGPRTGSTLLQTLINSHPQAVCMNELLREDAGPGAFYRHYLGQRRRLLRLRRRDVGAFVREVLLERQPPTVQAVGFKVLYMQPSGRVLDREAAWKALASVPELRVVHIRRNPVRSVVSFAVARETSAWIGKQTRGAIEVDPDYLLRRLALEQQKEEEALGFLGAAKRLEVSYEGLTRETASETARVQAFLGLAPHALSSPLRKQNPKPLSGMLSNYEAVAAALRGSPWREAFAEADAS